MSISLTEFISILLAIPTFMILGIWIGWFMAMKAFQQKVLELKQSLNTKN